jgi:hypothetical protein
MSKQSPTHIQKKIVSQLWEELDQDLKESTYAQSLTPEVLAELQAQEKFNPYDSNDSYQSNEANQRHEMSQSNEASQNNQNNQNNQDNPIQQEGGAPGENDVTITGHSALVTEILKPEVFQTVVISSQEEKLKTSVEKPVNLTEVLPPARSKKIPSSGISAPLSLSQAGGSPVQGSSSPQNHLQLAHYLKLAQDKVLDLEKEIDKLREENDLLVIAAQLAKKQSEELSEQLVQFEHHRVESLEQAQMELNIYRENLAIKEKERRQMEEKIRQLEGSVSKEVKKIRNRERELENRLELSKQEKIALLRSKDESILDLRRKVDDLQGEIEVYRSQNADLQRKNQDQHGQLSRTVKALRLALAHLDSGGESKK